MAFFNRLRLTLNYTHVEHDIVNQTIYSAKLDYRILSKLYLRTYYQRDTYFKKGLWNTLLQYEFFGGSNVYLVLNLRGDRLENTGRYFKISYEFNF